MSTYIKLSLDFSLKSVRNCRIKNVFLRTDKSVSLNSCSELKQDYCIEYHGIIGVHSPSPPPENFRSPLDTKASGPPLIYLVGPLAISDPLTLALLNLLPPNTLL